MAGYLRPSGIWKSLYWLFSWINKMKVYIIIILIKQKASSFWYMSSSHWVNSVQSTNSHAVGSYTSFSIFKSVCQSQNRKCVCESQNIKRVCRSQNSHTSVIHNCSWGFLCVTCHMSSVACPLSQCHMSTPTATATNPTPVYFQIFQIENVSVSHKISKCVCQSQNNHIESPSEAGGPRRTDNGMQWS